MAKPKKKKSPRVNKFGNNEKNLSLRKLVAKITPENRHKEIRTGCSVGREVVEW
jgi:antitoxin component of MazEF toxin-antitoxin module